MYKKMTVDDIEPQLQAGARKWPQLHVYKYWMLRIVRFLFGIFVSGKPCLDGVSYTDTDLDNAKVRVYRGEGEPSGVGVLWIHGGGLIAGSYKMDNKTCSRYVKELNAVVCSVEYRLAPEDPFPAGIDDCYEAWQWFVEQAPALGVDTSRMIVAGQSGGGCMAASLAQRIYDAGGIQPVAQLLFCPMLDDRTAAKTELDVVSHIGWTNRNNRAGWSWYTGCEAGAEVVPENSVPARRKDLTGLPTAWIGIGDIDLFYEESKVYADRLQQAGVNTVFDVVPDAPHGFEIFAEDTSLVDDYFARHFQTVRQFIESEKGATSTA